MSEFVGCSPVLGGARANLRLAKAPAHIAFKYEPTTLGHAWAYDWGRPIGQIPMPNEHAPVADLADPGDDALDRALVLARATRGRLCGRGLTAGDGSCPRTLFV